MILLCLCLLQVILCQMLLCCNKEVRWWSSAVHTESFSCPSLSAGVWVCGLAQRLHDPHASCAQLRYHQVSLQQAIPGLPQDPKRGVPAKHVSTLRLRCPKVHDGWEQQLATTADPHTPGPELLTRSVGWGRRGQRKRAAHVRQSGKDESLRLWLERLTPRRVFDSNSLSPAVDGRDKAGGAHDKPGSRLCELWALTEGSNRIQTFKALP